MEKLGNAAPAPYGRGAFASTPSEKALYREFPAQTELHPVYGILCKRNQAFSVRGGGSVVTRCT